MKLYWNILAGATFIGTAIALPFLIKSNSETLQRVDREIAIENQQRQQAAKVSPIQTQRRSPEEAIESAICGNLRSAPSWDRLLEIAKEVARSYPNYNDDHLYGPSGEVYVRIVGNKCE